MKIRDRFLIRPSSYCGKVLCAALDSIEINDGEEWRAEVEHVREGIYRFRLCCYLADTNECWPSEFIIDRHKSEQHGRWWYLDEAELNELMPTYDRAHALRLVWKAYETFMMHEMLERFRVDGKILFNPHFAINQENNNARTANDQGTQQYDYAECR